MKIRPKTVRRLLVIAAAVAATTGVVTATFYARRHAREARLADARTTGMAAFAAGDYATALPPLATYAAVRPDDVDALFALACAHADTPAPGRDHLFDARSRFQQVLARRPDHLPAKRRLMAIYATTNLPRELLSFADAVLAAVPGDVEATRSRATALAQLGRDAEAVDAWHAYLRLAPDDTRAQLQWLGAMRRAGATPDQVIAAARANADARPDDARYRLPLAVALRESGDEAASRAMLAGLAALPQRDATFVVELVGALDRGRDFDAAERVLARSADALDSSTLSAVLVERMWQSGRHPQVVATTDTLIAAGRADAGSLALRALSLAATGRRAEATTVVDELARRTADPRAAAWVDALAVEFAPARLTPAEQVRTLRDALARDPENGVARAWLGRALARTGDLDAAAWCLREAMQRMPSWSTPCVELAELTLSQGRLADAAAAAKAAHARSPGSAQVQAQVVRVHHAELRAAPDAAAEAALLASAEALRGRIDGDDRTILSIAPARVALLAGQGRADAARAAFRDAIEAARRAGPDGGGGVALLELYDLARRGGVVETDAAYEGAVAAGQVTPRLLLLRALELAARPAGHAPATTWARAQVAARAADAAWALVEPRLLEALGDAAAPDAWRRVLAAFPDDESVSAAALAEATWLRDDRAQQALLIERLKRIGGESAPAYRVARAHFFATSADDADLRQALTMSADLVRQQPTRADLRVLLARVLVRLDSAGMAVDHLRAAFDATPGDARLGLELVTLLQRFGRVDEAATLLARLARHDVEDAATRAQVAEALVDAGSPAEAAAMLGRAAARGPLDARGALLHAEALAATDQSLAAAGAFDALVAAPDAPPATLAAAAAFQRRQGHADRAATLVARLERADAPPTARARALARYAIAFGETDRARAAYAAGLADEAAGRDLAAEAIEFEASVGALDAAAALLRRAEARFPGDERLRLARVELAALESRGTGDVASIDGLIASMSADPAARPQVDALRALRAARVAGGATPELAARLARLAELYPTSLALAREAIDASLSTGQTSAAQAIASRLAAQGDASVEAVALAARTLAETRQWPAAARTAARWREMSKAAPRDADLTLARVALAEGDAARAAATLEPYRTTIEWPRDAALAAALVDALCDLGRAAEGFELVEPAAAAHAAARSVVTAAAVRCGNASAATGALARLESTTPGAATAERVRLAGAYLAIAERSDGREPGRRGLAVIAALGAAGDLPANARVLHAELLRVTGDAAGAESTLRDALRHAPSHAAAKNSLAYLLLARATDDATDESARLAAEAVAAVPTQPNFRDTLARAEWAAGRHERAEREFREALRLDPGSLDATIGLARLQSQRGETDAARAALRSVDALLVADARRPLPTHLRGEFESLRQAVTAVPAGPATP